MLVTSSSTCETNPKWDIRGGNPPQFIFSGSGRLISLRVYGPGEKASESDTEPYGTRYWEIRPKYAYDLRTHAQLPPVSYGTVPEGFIQIYPDGSSPKPLFEGGRFGFSLDVEGGDAVNALFTIRQNKVVVEPH